MDLFGIRPKFRIRDFMLNGKMFRDALEYQLQSIY